MRWPEAVTGKRSSLSRPLVASPCSLSVCGTILKSHRSRCGSLCSSPQHSSDSTCGDIIVITADILPPHLPTAGHLLLYFGVLHVIDRVSRVSLSLFQMPRPHVVHPVDQIDLHVQTWDKIQTVRKNKQIKITLKVFISCQQFKSNRPAGTYCGRPLDPVLQFGVAELQADNIIELLSLTRGGLIVTCPLGHGHLGPLLSAHIHHIYHASTTWEGSLLLDTAWHKRLLTTAGRMSSFSRNLTEWGASRQRSK